MKIKFPIIKIIATVLVCLFVFSCISKSNSERTKKNINENWLYLENDTEDLHKALGYKNWEAINLPHSWNSIEEVEVGIKKLLKYLYTQILFMSCILKV